jgi:capsid protein
LLEVESGFRSRSSVIGERGDDPEEVDEERAEDLEREKELGLWADPNPPAPDAPAEKDNGDSDGIDDDEYSAPPNARSGHGFA